MNLADTATVRLVRQPLFLSIAIGHFAVDVLNSQASILLAVLSTPLGLSHAQIGLAATVYSFAGSLVQPIFGWLADRYGSRWAAAGGLLWMTAVFALVATLPGYWPVLLLPLAALGSAAYHPTGAMQSTHVGQAILAGQMATAASIFFLFGQAGLSLGPFLGGVIVDHLGRQGILVLAVLAAPAGLFMARELRPAPRAASAQAAPSQAAARKPPPADLGVLALVLLISGPRIWVQQAVSVFAPKFFHDLGQPATVYGAVVAVFMSGTALGGVLGAMASDRWGARRTIVLSLLVSALPLYFFPTAGGAWVFILVGIAGFLNGVPHSVLVTQAQRSLPGRAALASGVILGFMFASGTLGVTLSGLAADRLGLGAILQANALISLVAAAASLALQPERRPAAAPALSSD